jgi:hypothetical protein
MGRNSLPTITEQREMIDAIRNTFRNRHIVFSETLSECGASFSVDSKKVVSIDWCLRKGIAVVTNHLSCSNHSVESDSGRTTVPVVVAASVAEILAGQAN